MCNYSFWRGRMYASAVGLCLGVCGFTLAQEDSDSGAEATLEEQTSFSLGGGASYLLSPENVFGDQEILWPGFLTGMRSFTDMGQRFADPIGNPLYFESPFIESNLRIFYMWHDFPKDSQLGGGEVSVFAAQVRLALTDKLAFIAVKDGYSRFKSGITPDAEGWNDFSIGLKYALIVDEANDFVLTTGLRWEWHNGEDNTLMGGDSGSNELSPFFSVAKGWDRFHFIGNLTARLPMDHNDGNHIIQWDLHFDYEIAPDTLPGFFPLFEIHALHYLSNGNRFPLSVGAIDYSNIGSSDVAGTSVFWGDLGFRWRLTPNVTIGAAYGFPISSPGNDAFNQRVTADLILSF